MSRNDARKATIYWRGKSLTIAEASALAAQEQRQGHSQAAVDIYDLILARFPNSAEVHNNRAALLQTMRRHDEALASYDKAIALKPDYANAHFNRGLVLKQMNRFEEALVSYDRALALKPGDPNILNSRGIVLQQLRRYDDAVASYDHAIAAKPDNALACNNRGSALLSKGDMEEAEKMFRKALELKPDFPDPLFNLATLRRYQDASDPDIANIRALLGKPDISSENREHLYFTLGKIYDDCGLYDEAFEAFRQANQIRNTFVSYQPAAVTKLTGDIIEVFNGDFLARRLSFASESKLPLFIVGMPRSGTTLLASILSNHPAIATAGELSTLSDLAARLPEFIGNKVPYPHAARHMTPAAAARVIGDYEMRLKRDMRPDATHIIDKNPLNFRHAGFISMLFPNAPIIHCARHPLDTVLSNYFQRFPLSLDYCFDLHNIAHFHLEYARLMEHWRSIGTLKLIEISYEDIILNTEQVVRKMLNFLGLEWSDRCLAPHTNPSPIETASHWQARQPIYDQSIGRWRHYEKYLAGIKEMLLPSERAGSATVPVAASGVSPDASST